MHSLPPELLENIAGFLAPCELAMFRETCRAWRDAADEVLRRKSLPRHPDVACAKCGKWTPELKLVRTLPLTCVERGGIALVVANPLHRPLPQFPNRSLFVTVAVCKKHKNDKHLRYYLLHDGPGGIRAVDVACCHPSLVVHVCFSKGMVFHMPPVPTGPCNPVFAFHVCPTPGCRRIFRAKISRESPLCFHCEKTPNQ